jgi:TonB-dependent receptor
MNVDYLLQAGRSALGRLSAVGLVAAFCAFAMPAQAQDADSLDDAEVEEIEEVIVRGFRGSLNASLTRKREATRQVDAITAEDIADFPDLNLAEALQRIPGVAISRQQGEGRQITVRGLGGRFTQTRINGMETRAAVAGNRSRAFDFNMFASELFNSIVVHKTAAAELEDGSLGAVIDLNSARAFNYDEGHTFLLGGEFQYNDASEDTDPRITALYAYHGDTFGATASVAYSESTTLLNTGNTVRWQKSNFNSVEGTQCLDVNGDPLDPYPPECAQISDAFHARIPRYGEELSTRERLGITLGLQFRPTDRTEISIDGLYSAFDMERDFRTIEVLFRGNAGGMDVTSFTMQNNPDRFGSGNSTITSMEVDNAWVRSEWFNQNTENTFSQLSASFSHEFSDRFWINGLIGTSNSEGDGVNETTLMYDDRDYNGYLYNYSSGSDAYPVLAFNGPDVTDGTNFQLTEVRDRPSNVESSFDNVSLDLHFEFSEALVLSGGIDYKKTEFDTESARRDGTVCGLGLYTCGSIGDGSDDFGVPGTAALTELFKYTGRTGSGSTTTWAVPSLKGWTDALGVYDLPAVVRQGDVRGVEEENLGFWAQLSGELPAGNMRFLYDVGVRHVETDQTSSGFNSGVFVTVDRDPYTDTLPSINGALWVSDTVVIRGAYAETLSRPALGNLSPGGSVDSFNFAVNFQNPMLDPTRSDNLDFSVEWYFADESVLAFAYFTKDIESFPIRDSRTGTFASTGLPLSVIAPTSPASQNPEGTCGLPEGCWEISELQNGPGADLDGYEISFQAPFSALFGTDNAFFSNLGFIGNYTYVDSEVDYDFSGNTITERLLGLSNDSYNATLYWENEVFGARVSWASRSDYLQSGPNRSGNLWQFADGTTYVDFAASYQVNDNLELTFQATNLTDESSEFFVDVDANRRLEEYTTGTNYLFGARYVF